jgi:hypothetical protein
MILVIGFLIYPARNLLVITETKFCETKLLLIIVFGVLIHMLLPGSNILSSNTNTVC